MPVISNCEHACHAQQNEPENKFLSNCRTPAEDSSGGQFGVEARRPAEPAPDKYGGGGTGEWFI